MIDEVWRCAQRRERSARVWQAIQCWALEMLARKRDEHMSPELQLAVERLSLRRD